MVCRLGHPRAIATIELSLAMSLQIPSKETSSKFGHRSAIEITPILVTLRKHDSLIEVIPGKFTASSRIPLSLILLLFRRSRPLVEGILVLCWEAQSPWLRTRKVQGWAVTYCQSQQKNGHPPLFFCWNNHTRKLIWDESFSLSTIVVRNVYKTLVSPCRFLLPMTKRSSNAFVLPHLLEPSQVIHNHEGSASPSPTISNFHWKCR